MNEKLSFKFGDIASRMTGRGSFHRDELVTVSMHKDKDRGDNNILRVSFHGRALEKLGWLAGDRISFSYDTGSICLFRASDGRSLSKTQSSRMVVRFRIPSAYSDVFAGDVSGVEIDAGKIAFDLVDEETK